MRWPGCFYSRRMAGQQHQRGRERKQACTRGRARRGRGIIWNRYESVSAVLFGIIKEGEGSPPRLDSRNAAMELTLNVVSPSLGFSFSRPIIKSLWAEAEACSEWRSQHLNVTWRLAHFVCIDLRALMWQILKLHSLQESNPPPALKPKTDHKI